MISANDLELLANANRYVLGKDIRDRLIKLINSSKEEDKLTLAINYAYSVTKCGMRGTK